MSTDQLTSAALKLPARRKAKLADQLLESLDSEAQRAIDAAWAKESESRINAYDKGLIGAKPIAKVLQSIKRRAKR